MRSVRNESSRIVPATSRSRLGVLTLLSLGLGIAGCVTGGVIGEESDGGNATGGARPGTGGATTASGGAVGSGGSVGSGGANASGGSTGSGGLIGTGGASNTGGSTTATGGRSGTGGNGSGGAGTGGRAGTGGASTGGSGSGGRAATGGAGTGGRAATGGAPGTGGSTGTTACTTVGATTTVSTTIQVGAGQTYDGACKRFIAASSLGDGSQAEGQEPVFEIASGGTLINVVLGFPAADGIHTNGNATLRNIVWEDIGEDALTIKASGTVTLDGGSSQKGSDKTFQINAASTFRLSNFKATTAGKLIRQNGGTTYKVAVFIDRCDISNMSEAIFRTDSSTSTVSMTNTRYSNIGDTLFYGVAAANITQSNNTEY